MKNTLHKGPFPLAITKNGDAFVILTNHTNHYATTYDPSAARLIASAPDLLDALHAIIDAFGHQDSLLMDQCKAALSKATA